MRWNDATVHGDLDAELMDAEVEISFSNQGEQTYKGGWKTKSYTVRQFFDWLSKHKQGEKDGPCFMQGAVVGGDRNAAAVKHQDFLVLDCDTGESLEAVRERIKAFGKLAMVYTTHSHMKRVSEVKRDALIKWLELDGEDDPTDAQVIEYLLHEKHYDPAVLKDAKVIKTEHTPRGVMVFVEHQPMPKARIVFVLAKRFSFSQGGTQQERGKLWKERYAGLAKLLDLAIDKTCVDIPRLFFLPRHAPGNPYQIDIYPGEFLDLEEVPRVTAAELKASDPFSAAAKSLGGGGAGGVYSTSGLKWFFGKYADRFDLADFLLEVDPDGDRGSRSTGAGRHHRCPNDDAHTDAGNEEDRGFFCVNALDAESETCVGKCMHASCADLDRINFVDLACQAVGIKDATDLLKWVPEVEGEEREGEGQAKPADAINNPAPPGSTTTTAAPIKGVPVYASGEEARAAIEAIPKGDDDAAIEIARRVGASPDLTAGVVGGLMKKLQKASGISVRALEAERKTGEKSRPKDKGEVVGGLDDDGMRALARWNRDYAVVTMGGKVRILQEPSKAGTMPPLFELDAFKTLQANQKILAVTSDGDTKQEPLSKHWLEWPDRRTYGGGIVFEPSGCRKDEYNLWRGFPVKASKGDWSLLRDHMFLNICQANEENFTWLMTWLAQIFQQPGVKLGSTVAIKGLKGTGKSKLFDWVRRAMGQHAIKVNQKSHITGNFNGHQAGVLLMVCEEAFWAGDAAAGGVLKDMITSPTMMMEKKGVDPVEVSSFVRLVMISNEHWIVPAGMEDERRYFVLECGGDRRGDLPFFAAIDKQMERGGLEAMVHEFMHWKPEGGDWAVLRSPPVTPWLKEQAAESLEPWDRFFVQVINDGGCDVPGQPGDVESFSLSEVATTKVHVNDFRWFYNYFLSRSSKGSFRLGNTTFMHELTKKYLLVDETIKTQNVGGKRHDYYDIPPLSIIRDAAVSRGLPIYDVEHVS